MPSTELSPNERVGHYVEFWKQTIQVQQHFNDIEWRIRGLALTALTVTIGAAAVAAGRGERLGPLSLGSVVLAVGLGLWYAFYFVDKHWYHPLLKAAVRAGEDLETIIEAYLPGARLTKEISAGSPYTPKPLFGKIRIRKSPMHSPDKLNWFYRTGAVALILFALALQFGPSLAGPTESGGSEDAPAVAPD